MKRIATWVFYAIGGIAILYLALYAYTAFTGHGLEPGDPIHIFRKPDATKQAGLERFNRAESDSIAVSHHFRRSAILSAAALAHTSSLSPPGAPPTPIAPTI